MEESLIKKLMTSIKCTVCGKCYEAEHVAVLGNQEDLWFLKALCPSCRSEFIVAVVVQEGGEPNPITDLSEAELDRLNNAGELTADDMLDMRNYLKNFDGNFSRLFNLSSL